MGCSGLLQGLGQPWASSSCSRPTPLASSMRAPCVHTKASSGPVAGTGSKKVPWGMQAAESAVPAYLQNTSRRPFPCEEGPASTTTKDGTRWPRESAIWLQIRDEAQKDAMSEPLLSSFLFSSVLAHDSFEKSLAFVLSNRLADTVLLPTQLFETFIGVLSRDADVRCGALADIEAVRERDPACRSLVQPLLYCKGYLAIQTHRPPTTWPPTGVEEAEVCSTEEGSTGLCTAGNGLQWASAGVGATMGVIKLLKADPTSQQHACTMCAHQGFLGPRWWDRCAHSLWNQGDKLMALALQSRSSEVFAVDIHPAARLGKGLLMDHGTGVVIGETAVVGDNCSLLQNITLGGTGKEHGDRHPKIGDNVLIGANSSVLGNIKVGNGSQIAAGSLVVKPVLEGTMVAGSPAREVGRVSCVNPAKSMDQCQGLITPIHMPENILFPTSQDQAQAEAVGRIKATPPASFSPSPNSQPYTLYGSGTGLDSESLYSLPAAHSSEHLNSYDGI